MTVEQYSLHKDAKSNKWRLELEGSNRAKATYDTKEEALRSLKADIGVNGGSVRIRKSDNTIQEERTYPRAKDPRRTPG